MIDFINISEISLLARLMVAHLLTDFLFQKDSWVKNRFIEGWSSRYLYLHGVWAGILAYLLSGLWTAVWLPLVVAGTHTIIDGLKARRADNIVMFLLDQAGHAAVLLFVWILAAGLNTGEVLALVGFLSHETIIWIIIFAYITVIWPAGILVDKATAQWRTDVETAGDSGLEKAGLWIGRLERFLILTFVLLDQFQAIGLLIAAKSIFRFNEARKEGEYVLIGTLISIVIAIVVGLLASLLIR